MVPPSIGQHGAPPQTPRRSASVGSRPRDPDFVGRGFVVLVGVAIAGLALGGAACGGGAKTPVRAAPRDAGAEGGSKLATSPPPSGLPPLAAMPAPGVVGSKKAKERRDPALLTCGGAARAQAKDPADLVKRVGEACAPVAKMRPVGGLLRGQQGDKDAHQENRFKAEANHCYRVYFAGDEAAKDVVVILRDSAGDIVAEAPGPAVPENGASCFTTSDEVTVLVGVGSGKGAWAAQVWSD
jgi:hypothetical protein